MDGPAESQEERPLFILQVQQVGLLPFQLVFRLGLLDVRVDVAAAYVIIQIITSTHNPTTKFSIQRKRRKATERERFNKCI
jgi:hypothetical protein